MRNGGLSKNDLFCRKIIDYGILAIIILSPLPAGSVNEWSILAIQLLVLIMGAAYVLMNTKPEPNESLINSMKWARIFFLGFFVFLVFQILPLPIWIVKIISPNTITFKAQFGLDGHSGAKWLSLSMIPAHTFRKSLEFLSYVLLGFLVLRTVTTRTQIRRIIYAIIGTGTFQTLYGLVELYNSNPHILFYKKLYNLDSASGTFVNRNHFSGYLEMAIPIGIGLLLSQMYIIPKLQKKWRRYQGYGSEKTYAKLMFVGISIISMSLGVILSKSRSGIFVLVFSFFLILGLLVLNVEERRKINKGRTLIVLVLFLIVTIFAFQIGIGSAIERFSMDDLLKSGRPTYWATAAQIFSQHLIFGAGFGTFPSLAPDKEIGDNILRLYHAHNDFLEFLSELGIVGFLLLFGGILLIIWQIFWIWIRRRNPEVIGLAIGGLVAITSMFIHSITDFNMQIPANILLFSVIVSLTLVIVNTNKENSKRIRIDGK